MTMVPAQNLSKQNHRRLLCNNNNNKIVYGGRCGGEEYSSEFYGVMSRVEEEEEEGYELYCSTTTESLLGSDLLVVGPIMAEDESRTNSLNEAGSSSNKEAQEDHERDEGNWLQLSIGSYTGSSHSHENKNNVLHHHHHHHHQPVIETSVTATTPRRSSGLIELDLLPGSSSRQARSSSSSMAPMFHVPEISTPQQRQVSNFGNFSTSLYFQNPGSSSSSNMINMMNFPHHQQHQAQPQPHHHHEAVNWTFRPFPAHNIFGSASSACNSSSSSSSTLMPLGSSPSSYFARQFQIQSGIMDVGGPSLDFRVVNPPRRPQSGIWFMLQASQNQAKEPFLPQISKNYLRIKDGRMTVRLLMKYLVNKLRLESESEIEITCRGQQLLPFLTLQHVRDNIWSPRDAVTLLPPPPNNSDPSSSTTSTIDHVMVLHYARSTTD